MSWFMLFNRQKVNLTDEAQLYYHITLEYIQFLNFIISVIIKTI